MAIFAKKSKAFKVLFLFILAYRNVPKIEINIKTPSNTEFKG